jgi:hypothetical protein
LLSRQSQYYAKQGQRRQSKYTIQPVNTSDNGNECSSDSIDSEYCYVLKKCVKTHLKAYPFNSAEPVKMKGRFQTVVESCKRITVSNATAQ